MLKNNQKIPLDKFIQKTLYDKNKGYYIKKNPIGYKGDFITSPYLSIMFSEMIAIWLVSFWKKLGSPQNINIVELGAGNGEMIYQIIKAINNFKKFKLSSKFFIHEKSKYLKKIQKNKNIINNIIWVENLKKLSRSPTIFIANEFFDAFPFKQFIKKKNIWFEKYITSKDSKLRMIDVKKKFSYLDKIINEKLSSNIKFIEYSPVALKKLGIISKIIKKNNGGILIIDYGYNSKKMFDTLQSVKNHKKNNFLENVYSSDITHMLNFRHYILI